MNNKKYILLFLLCFLMPLTSVAQRVSVRGVVRDAVDNEPLPRVSVRLLQKRDSAYVAGTTGNNEGVFRVNDIPHGNYIVQFSFLGYSTQYVNINTRQVRSQYNMGEILMSTGDIVLAEATVVGKAPEVVVKEDTIEFNADSYKTQPSAVVEDLLKRLPGVEVDETGKITANGKEVTKILLDGKEFFSDDPKVASKNIPVEMVQKLQVVDRKSDLARITGVDDGEEETVINLTIKPGMKQGWFGEIQGGYGYRLMNNDNTSPHRYQGGAMVNYIKDDDQFTLILNSNNVNSMGFTDQGQGRFRRWGGNNGIATSHSLGLNFNVGNQEIFRVGGDVMYSYNDRDTRKRSERQDFFSDSTSYSDLRSEARDIGQQINARFRVQWNPDSINTFEFRPRISVNFNDSRRIEESNTFAGDAARTQVNRNYNYNNSNGVSLQTSGELIYNRQLTSKPGRSFSVHGRYNFSNTTETGNSIDKTWYYLLRDTTDLDQTSNDHSWSNGYSARLTYTEPIGKPENGMFLTFALRSQGDFRNADKYTYTADEFGVYPLDPDTAYSNSFRNMNITNSAQIGFRHVTRNLNYNVGLSFEPTTTSSQDLMKPANNIDTYTVYNWAPFMWLTYKVDKQTSLRMWYNGRTEQPTIAQLQPVPDISNPLNVVVGNPDLAPSFTHRLRMRFSDYDTNTQRSIMAHLRANYTMNSIISATEYNSETGGRVTSYENVDGVWSVNGMFMITLPFRDKRWQFNNFTRLGYSSSAGKNNGEYNRANQFSAGESLSLAFRSTYFDTELRGNYNLQHVRNTVQTGNNRTVHNYGGTYSFTVNLPFGMTIGSDITYSGNEGYTDGYNQNVWLWNAQISYSFLAGKNATIMLKGVDLLNQSNNIQRTVTGNYLEDVEYNTLNHYCMVSFSYRFNTFGKDKPQMRGQFGPGFGPPPGRH
ncbi:MAG: outer membrane beta-barrel protein [Bacteroidaceae bacterium]|nr:outer membrane beta-barrel protein [Bacteroidaceae bacterium]